MSEKVAAIVGTEMRGVSPDALGEVATSLKLLVRRAEKKLCTVNKADEWWLLDIQDCTHAFWTSIQA